MTKTKGHLCENMSSYSESLSLVLSHTAENCYIEIVCLEVSLPNWAILWQRHISPRGIQRRALHICEYLMNECTNAFSLNNGFSTPTITSFLHTLSTIKFFNKYSEASVEVKQS